MDRTPQIEVSSGLRGRVPRPLARALARRVRSAARRMGVGPERVGGISLRLVDDREMRALNREFAGEDHATDVLSFPPSGDPGEVVGDIALDWDVVQRQAREASHPAWLDELTVLAVHGLAHLLGHDHRTPDETRAMHRLELRGLRAARCPDAPRPYRRQA